MTGGRRRHTALALACVLAPVTALAACSHDSKPPPQPIPTTSPRSTPVIKQPTAPKAAATAKSAEDFVRFLWQLYNYSYDTKNTAELRSISGPRCDFCRGIVDDVGKSKSNGTRNVGGHVRVMTVAAPPGKVEMSVVVTSILSQEPGRVLDRNNEVISTTAAIDAISTSERLDWQEDHWQVAAVTIVQRK